MQLISGILVIAIVFSRENNESPLFLGSIIKNAAQNTLHGVFYGFNYTAIIRSRSSAASKIIKKAQHFLSMKPKYNSCIVSHFIKCTHIIVNQIVRL